MRKLHPGSFYGEKLKSCEIDGFRLSEWVFQPNARTPWHSHECAFFNMCIEGGHTETYRQGSRVCDRFILVFHPVGESHANFFQRESPGMFYLEIEPWLLDRARTPRLILDRPAESRGGLPVWFAHRLYCELRCMDDVSPLAMQGLALELLVE